MENFLVHENKQIFTCYFTLPTCSGYLAGWADQGVLLLNAVLTVRSGAANSHKDKG